MTKLVTGKVRFSYAHVFVPTSIDDNAPKKYSVSLIIPKSDTATIQALEAAVRKTAEDAKQTHFNGTLPFNLQSPLRDGDEKGDAIYSGCFYVNAKSNRKPGVVDANIQPILNQEEFYSGCYGRASICFYAYNVGGNKGVACGILNLQKLEEGANLSGGTSTPEEDFS